MIMMMMMMVVMKVVRVIRCSTVQSFVQPPPPGHHVQISSQDWSALIL